MAHNNLVFFLLKYICNEVKINLRYAVDLFKLYSLKSIDIKIILLKHIHFFHKIYIDHTFNIHVTYILFSYPLDIFLLLSKNNNMFSPVFVQVRQFSKRITSSIV